MTTDYNNFATSFSKSRKNMKWAELEYFFSVLEQGSILDIGCGSGRFLQQYSAYFNQYPEEYYGLDMSTNLIGEAKKAFPDMEFGVGNMLEIKENLGNKKYKNIFLIASFHHLESLKEREEMMGILYEICEDAGKIYMTNWALDSSYNHAKYMDSKIGESENEFGSSDFHIKFGKHNRFYHSFGLRELEYLTEKGNFQILENRLFQGEKNIITIMQK